MILPITIPETGRGYNLQHMVSFKQASDGSGEITIKWSDGTSQLFTGDAAKNIFSEIIFAREAYLSFQSSVLKPDEKPQLIVTPDANGRII